MSETPDTPDQTPESGEPTKPVVVDSDPFAGHGFLGLYSASLANDSDRFSMTARALKTDGIYQGAIWMTMHLSMRDGIHPGAAQERIQHACQQFITPEVLPGLMNDGTLSTSPEVALRTLTLAHRFVLDVSHCILLNGAGEPFDADDVAQIERGEEVEANLSMSSASFPDTSPVEVASALITFIRFFATLLINSTDRNDHEHLLAHVRAEAAELEASGSFPS